MGWFRRTQFSVFGLGWLGSLSPARPTSSRSPIKGCKASYSRTNHDYPASDVFADKGCSVVAVTGGVIDQVSRRDTWSARKNEGATRGGLSVSVVGTDGVRYYYSHLSAIKTR